MKKTVTLFALILSFFWATAQCTVPNASFENTSNLNFGLNSITHPTGYTPFLSTVLSFFAGGTPGIDSTQDAQSGNLALELFKDSAAGYPVGGDVLMAMPCNGFVSNVSGYYKMTNNIGDTAGIIFVATAYNRTLQRRDTVGIGGINVFTNTTGYSSFSFNPIYPSLNVTPDSLTLWAFYLPNVSGNTSFKLDNLSFRYLPVSLYENERDVFNVYPNPTNESLKISAPNAIGEVAQLMDMKGQVLLEININQQQEIIDVSSLSPGVYFLRLGEKNEKILIQR